MNIGRLAISNGRGWALAGVAAAAGALLGEKLLRRPHPVAGALIAGLPALAFLGYATAAAGNAMFQILPAPVPPTPQLPPPATTSP